tara:strand:- start:6058 stop:6333 length:276 start_codon:yes stop_codon:yes gene_type:complete
MKTELLETLVERELVNHNTIVYAHVQAEGLGGQKIMIKKDVYYNSDIPAGAICDIEGMEPTRFAKAYNIKPDGSYKSYKKRGRKTKDITFT